MKKLLLIAMVLVSVFAVQSQASYRTTIVALRNSTDTSVVLPEQRIDHCIKSQAASILKGEILKSALTNETQFTDAQLKEFCLRCVKGSMLQLLMPFFTDHSQFNGREQIVTDAQLRGVFVQSVWPIILLIGNGSL